jgi:SPP1 family predicted phage head-tail adaptor
MSGYTPVVPFNVTAWLLIPTYETVKGISKKTYTKDEEPFNCGFRSFGGTETVVNGVTVVEDTAVIETWYDPRIKSGCKVLIEELEYEIMGTPENINMRNQYMRFKVRAIKGGA